MGDSDNSAKLVVESGPGRKREYVLGPITTIGRHPMQTIQVLDPQVSKEHIVVERTGVNGWLVRDMGSLNGTFVNDEALKGSIRLRHQDRLRVGSFTMLFWDPQSMATGDHTVTIGDAIESSVREALNHGTATDFLPAEKIQDVVKLRADYEKLRLTAALHKEIALELRFDKLLPRILDVLLGLFQADRGVILLANSSTGELEARAVQMQGKKAKPKEAIALSQTMLNRVVNQHEAVLTNDAQHDSRFASAHSVIISGIRSSMCAPLMGRNRQVIGAIHLDSLYAPGQFTELDLSVLQGVANQAAIAIENAQLVERIQKEAVMRQNFQKMFAPQLVDKIVSGDLKIEKGGTLKNVTVMFTDIRAFTQLVHKAPPQEVVKLLNEYFEILVDVIFDYDGIVDKFIGDSVMALWGTPVDDPERSRKAVEAAAEIQRELDRFNALRELDGLDAIDTGIGIDTGEIVVGYMGSSKTMSYTVVGDSVNLASRLCAAAGPGEILLSQRTRDDYQGDIILEERPAILLKGFDDPIPTFSVVPEVKEGSATESRTTAQQLQIK
jgi:adenylate cyclase